MDAHRLAEARSVAYHALIAERIEGDPGVLERARERVRSWLAASPEPPHYARAWAQVLSRGDASIRAFLVDPGELACELRQSSPFAGELDPRERWEIWRRTRDMLEPG